MPPTTDRPEQHPALPAQIQDPRRLAAFVHADIAGYSRLVGLDDAGTSAHLADIRRTLIDPALARFGGHIVNTAGDSMLMEFGSVVAALRCAIEIQAGMADFDDGRPPDRRVRYRMGVHIGDAITDSGNLHGDGVNIAARLQSVCPPGELCVSRAVRDEIRGRLGLAFRALGALELKNIGHPVEAFLVHVGESVAEAPPTKRPAQALYRPPAYSREHWRVLAPRRGGSRLEMAGKARPGDNRQFAGRRRK
jgi:class 3 adenylate cyclase